MIIAVSAGTIPEAMNMLQSPVVAGVVLDESVHTRDSFHQFAELCVSSRQHQQQVFVQIEQSDEGVPSVLEELWRQSIYVIPVLKFSSQALALASYAHQRGLVVHLSGITSLLHLHESIMAGSAGAWLSLQQLDRQLERTGEDLLNRSRAVVDQSQSPFTLVASDITSQDQFAYALEYGADVAVMPAELLA